MLLSPSTQEPNSKGIHFHPINYQDFCRTEKQVYHGKVLYSCIYGLDDELERYEIHQVLKEDSLAQGVDYSSTKPQNRNHCWRL